MKINLKDFVKPTQEIDEQLLENVDYNDMLFCVSKTLVDYRNHFNYTQEDIAKELNMSQDMVSKIESGKNNLSLKVLVKIWNKLSRKDYNFSAILLNRMLKKAKENYDIKYNVNKVFYTVIEEKKNDYAKSDLKEDTNCYKIYNYKKFSEAI